jgi:hypothetical protein
MDKANIMSRVRIRTHGSVGRRRVIPASDPIIVLLSIHIVSDCTKYNIIYGNNMNEHGQGGASSLALLSVQDVESYFRSLGVDVEATVVAGGHDLSKFLGPVVGLEGNSPPGTDSRKRKERGGETNLGITGIKSSGAEEEPPARKPGRSSCYDVSKQLSKKWSPEEFQEVMQVYRTIFLCDAPTGKVFAKSLHHALSFHDKHPQIAPLLMHKKVSEYANPHNVPSFLDACTICQLQTRSSGLAPS